MFVSLRTKKLYFSSNARTCGVNLEDIFFIPQAQWLRLNILVTSNEAKRLGVADVTHTTATRRVELIPAFMPTLIQLYGLPAG